MRLLYQGLVRFCQSILARGETRNRKAMTIKEQAHHLVDSMFFIITNNGQFSGEHSIPGKYQEAKKCALVAARRIKEELTLALEIQDPQDGGKRFLKF